MRRPDVKRLRKAKQMLTRHAASKEEVLLLAAIEFSDKTMAVQYETRIQVPDLNRVLGEKRVAVFRKDDRPAVDTVLHQWWEVPETVSKRGRR